MNNSSKGICQGWTWRSFAIRWSSDHGGTFWYVVHGVGSPAL